MGQSSRHGRHARRCPRYETFSTHRGVGAFVGAAVTNGVGATVGFGVGATVGFGVGRATQ